MFDKLTKRFLWQPELSEFLGPLTVPEAPGFQIERLSKGIDNKHVDVALSSRFMEHSHLLVRQQLSQFVAEQRWRGIPSAHIEGDMEVIREDYAKMMKVALDRARELSNLGTVPLLQLGVIKYFFQVVVQEIERLRGQMQTSRESSKRQSSGRAVEIHERLVVLSKEERSLRFRIVRRLVKELLKIEETRLSKQRETLLQCAWPIPREVLTNPILMLPSLWADEQLMNDYPIVLTATDDSRVFDQINRLVTAEFGDYLPADTWPVEAAEHTAAKAAEGAAEVHKKQADPEVLPGFYEVKGLLAFSLQEAEYERGSQSWLDCPDNMHRFIYSASDRRKKGGQEKSPWNHDRWVEFHGRTLRNLVKSMRRLGLESRILAAYAAPEHHKQLAGALPVRLIAQYLSGQLSRRAILLRLRAVGAQTNLERSLSILDQGASKLKRMPAAQRRAQLHKFIIDFTLFRRDLKLAYYAHRTMSGIRILTRPSDLELSRGNGTLNGYVDEVEESPERLCIVGHAVLKADVRGSTSIIRELLKRQLNPASHFSLNFFEPINSLLREYGAKKTFVEGDAVILSVFEYDNATNPGGCVSLACGLARKILQVVEAQNVSSRQNGLPALELGLGIAYVAEAPTFLYDELREIMISPAINRADQLSSCNAGLRKSDFGRNLGDGVEVVMSGKSDYPSQSSREVAIRYNVNGIELDTLAFTKLQSETALQALILDENFNTSGSRFYVGRFSDAQGKSHVIVIREAAIRVWEGGKPGEGQQFGRRFYQVVTKAELIEQAQRQLQLGSSAPEGAPESTRDGSAEKRYLH